MPGKGCVSLYDTIRSIDLGPGTFSFGVIAALPRWTHQRIIRGLFICLDLTLGMTEHVPFLASPLGILLRVTR